MVNISGASATGYRTEWARWLRYTSFAWALLFSLMQLYWAELFLVYPVTGGALFVATAWLANRRDASRTTPAVFVEECLRPRQHEGGAAERRTP